MARKPAIDFGRDEEVSEFMRQYRRVHPLTKPDYKVTRARKMKADNEYGRTVRRKQAEGYVIFEDDSMLHKSKFPKRRSVRERQKLAKQAKSQGEVVRNRRLKEKYGK